MERYGENNVLTELAVKKENVFLLAWVLVFLGGSGGGEVCFVLLFGGGFVCLFVLLLLLVVWSIGLGVGEGECLFVSTIY